MYYFTQKMTQLPAFISTPWPELPEDLKSRVRDISSKGRELLKVIEKEAEAAYRDLGEDAKRADFLEREREIQVRSNYL